MTGETPWAKTHCARMDHGGCALLVKIVNNRIVRVKGDPEGYLNHGYVCSKALASPDRLDHPHRLRHPLKRAGKRGEGRWEKISWGKALSEIAQQFNRVKERFGAKGVAFCQGMPKGLEHFALIRLANLFGSPNVVVVQDVCHAPREVTGLHTCGFYPVADFHQKSELVVLWGSNPVATNEEGGICRLFLERVREGARLMVIDPRRTELAEKSEHFLQIRPGTDLLLALSFLHVILSEGLHDEDFVNNWTHGFEDLKAHVADYSPEQAAEPCGVAAEVIRAAARAYAAAQPATLAWGNAIEQTIHTFDTVRALICLMAVCGNLDVAGGNIQAVEPPVLPLGRFVRADRLPDKWKEMINAHYRTLPKFMTVPSAYFRKAVLEEKPYPIKAAYVQCANPLPGYADSNRTYQALMALDFLAVSEIFMTPTAMLADIVMPAATHFEFNDLGHYGLGHGIVLARPGLVEPPAECRSDLSILNTLGKMLTSEGDWFENDTGMIEAVLAPAGLDFEAFVERGYLTGRYREKKYRHSGFRTPSGKVELALSRGDKMGVAPLPTWKGPPEKQDPAFPLLLTCSKDPHYLHSAYRWLGKLHRKSPKPVARIHPATAGAHGLKDGEAISIETLSGRMVQTVRIDKNIRPDVVHAAYGWWFEKSKADGGTDWRSANYNLLTSMEKTGQAFGTPNLKGINCRIRKTARPYPT